MDLLEFKNHIKDLPKGTEFEYGISDPFSWRGSYDEVAFEILEQPMTREEILARIEKAYTDMFYGYKGGEYRYSDYTTVNFEEGGYRSYSDGQYCADMIAKIENEDMYQSNERKLVKMAFIR